MKRQPGCYIAILLAPVMLSMSGCSRDVPTSSAIRTDRSAERFRASGRAVTFVVPEAIASIRHLPEMGILEGGGGDGDAQSSYFRTTDANREFRRGFAEFVIPRFKDVFSARIVLRETRAGTSYPLPPDRHELSYYTDVDLFVNTNDFDRPTSPLGTFESDGNLPQQKFEFDVARLVTHLRGAKIGFRVKLDADPTYAGMGFLGTAFSGSSTPSGVRIEVTTTPAEANDWLQVRIGRMGLAARLEARLLAPLQQVGDILRDDHPDNDRAACAKLGEFIAEVKAHEQDGLLLVTQYTDLEELAQNIMTSLGCPARSPGGASLAG